MPSFKEYQMMFQLSASTSAQFGAAFSGAQAQITQLQSKIDALNQKQGDITAYQKQQQAVEKTREQLARYQEQLAKLQQAQDKAGGSDDALKDKMLQKQLQIEKTTDKLGQQEQKLDQMGEALNRAGVDTGHLTEEMSKLDTELETTRAQQDAVAEEAAQMGASIGQSMQAMQSALAASGLIDGLKKIGEALEECVQASIEYESAMAGVKRTVGGSDQFIGEIGTRFKELSTQIPITAEELAKIATTAGQLGIAQENVEQFTTVMAQLATTTDLSADDAATMLAQFANITGTTDYERLGSTIAELGDATATTASKVVEMSQGMAAAATLAGFSETDILALSASIGSLGIEASSGSTAMSTIISNINKAVETGDGLEEFASIANMTSEQFKVAWGENAAGALDSFIQGLNDTERNGASAVVLLDELGIKNVRQTKAVLGLANAGDLLSRTLSQASAAWDENTALGEKAGIMYGTTESRLTMMQNAANNVKISIGDALTPALASAADAMTGILQPVAEWLSANPAVVQGLTTVVGIFGGLTAAVVGVGAAFKVAAAMAGLFSAAVPGLGGVLAVAAGIAALTGGMVYLSGAMGDTGMSFDELNDQFNQTMTEIETQDGILNLIQQSRDLQEELGLVDRDFSEMGSAKSVTVTMTAEVAENGGLTAEDFVDHNYIELTAKQANQLVASDFLPDGLYITLTAEMGNELAASGYLDNTTVYLTAEQANELLAKGYLDEDTVKLQAEQGNYIEGQGFISDAEVQLTPEAAKYLSANNFMEGLVVPLTPEAAKLLNQQGLLTGSEVELTPEAASFLAAEGFLEGTEVELTAEAAERLAAEGFLDGQTVLLNGDVAEDGTVSTDDMVTGSREVEIKALVDIEEAQGKVADLESKIKSVSTALDTAKGNVTQLETKFDEVQTKLKEAEFGTQEYKDLNAERFKLMDQLDDERTKVETLQGTYDELNAQYTEAKTVVDEYKAKEEELAAVNAQLAEASGGVVTATAEQSDEFNKQIDLLEQIARLKRESAIADLRANLAAYGQAAADTIEADAMAMDRLAEKQIGLDQANYMALLDARNLAEEYNNMLEAYEAYTNAPEYDPTSEEALLKAQEMATILRMMGYDIEALGGVSQLMSSGMWASGFKKDASSADTFRANVQQLNADIADLSNSVIEGQENLDQYANTLFEGVAAGYITVEEAEQYAATAFEGVEGGAGRAASVMETVRKKMAEAAAASEDIDEGVDDASQSAAELASAVDPVIAKIDELAKAYQKAYDAALKSAEGQFDLFEKVGKIKPGPNVNSGKDSMVSGLESQTEYWTKYNDMLTKAQEMGYNMDMLGQLSDGSTESYAALQKMTEAKPEDVEALNQAYADAVKSREQFATTTAEINTDFSAKMEELQGTLEKTISEMNMSSEAASAAKDTFSSMVTAADESLPSVQAAYARIAAAAQAELDKIHFNQPETPGGGGEGGGEAAEGTDSANRGVYLVGEKGPELVYMHGGEKVFPHDETESILNGLAAESALPAVSPTSSSEGATINFAPVYNITGGSADDIREVLAEHDEGLRDMLERLLEDIEADHARRAYA